MRVNKVSPPSTNAGKGKEQGEGVLKTEAQEEDKNESSEDDNSATKVTELDEIAEFFKNLSQKRDAKIFSLECVWMNTMA